LDLGCGLGLSSITLAQGYPRAIVHGVDLDEKSITEARAAAAAAGVADRVTFATGDAAHRQAADTYDLVMIFETLHDLADPVATLRAARSALADHGNVLIADERVADCFSAPAGLLERFQYGWSVLHCLPATLATGATAANGTVLRAPTVARWARNAGFREFEILPIDNDFWRFYRLRR
jgi:ubiquinone/menaquinone biosynthesis C-methylase UbiE